MFENHTREQLVFAINDIKNALHAAVDREDIHDILKYAAQLTQAKEVRCKREKW